MEDKKIPGYVHLFKISIGSRILVNEANENMYRFVASQGMNLSLIGLKKFIAEIENSELVKIKKHTYEKDSNIVSHTKENISIAREIDVFVSKKDLPDMELRGETHFICYVDSYLCSIEEILEILAFAIV